MGPSRPTYRCRWVRDRLPLLAGGELAGADRRKVERHLIACPGCRRHRASLDGALGALRAAAAEAPAGLPAGRAAPGLWPALERQIREAKHEPRSAPITFPGSGLWLDRLATLRPAWALAAALVVTGLSAVGFDRWVHDRLAASRAVIAANSRPIRDGLGPLTPEPPAPSALDFPLAPQIARVDPSASPPERPGVRFDYDLDHGTPMGPDADDVKPSY